MGDRKRSIAIIQSWLDRIDQIAEGIKRQRKPPSMPATATQTNANPWLVY